MVQISKINLNIKVDPELKKMADAVFKAMGMNTSVAINMFLQRSVDDGQLPFLPRINNATEQAIEDVKLNHNLKSFSSVKELFEDLNGEN